MFARTAKPTCKIEAGDTVTSCDSDHCDNAYVIACVSHMLAAVWTGPTKGEGLGSGGPAK